MHEKQKITQIETGLPPKESFFNVISLTLLPHWAILCFGSHLQNLLTFSHYLQANIVLWIRLIFNKQVKINFLVFKTKLQLPLPHVNYAACGQHERPPQDYRDVNISRDIHDHKVCWEDKMLDPDQYIFNYSVGPGNGAVS